MFTNHAINGYVYETRFIASWLNVGGQLKTGRDMANFHNWLLKVGVSESDAKHIEFLATNGRLELEVSARDYISKLTEII